MRWTEPTEENVKAYREWVAERPPQVKAIAERFDPWTLYWLKSPGQRVTVLGFDEMNDGRVCVRVNVSGRFNALAFERQVFGVDPDDLEECDLPGPDEVLGSLDLPIEVVRKALGRSEGN